MEMRRVEHVPGNSPILRMRRALAEPDQGVALGSDRPHVVAATLLNHLSFEGMGLGDLLARELEDVLGSSARLDVKRRLRLTGATVLRGLRRKCTSRDWGARVIVYQSGDREHLKAIARAVSDTEPELGRVAVAGSLERSDVPYWELFGQFGVADVWRAGAFVAKNLGHIRGAVHTARADSSASIAVAVTLIRQLLHGVSAKRWLTMQSTLGLVAADFDRGHDTAVLCAASKTVGISSCSFQHGVLIPSPVASNFTPIVADFICVRGEAAQAVMVAEGVCPQQVVIVGNPTVSLADGEVGETETDHGDIRNLIVLALSAPDQVKDRHLVAHFSALRDEWPLSGFRFAVKLHPARKPENYAWIEHEFDIPLVGRDKSRVELMSELVAVLVSNSTFGIDAARHGVAVGVIKHPDVPIGYGQGFVDYLGMPVVDSCGVLLGLVQGRFPVARAALEQVVGGPVGDRVLRFVRERTCERQPSIVAPDANRRPDVA